MSDSSDRQLAWLRRGLSAFVGLLALAVTCGLIWGLLASLGDSVGTRAFRIVTLSTIAAGGMCGIALFVGAVRCLIQVLESRECQ